MWLYHIENLTPDAKEQGESIIKKNAQRSVIDSPGDAFLSYVKDGMTITVQENGIVEVK